MYCWLEIFLVFMILRNAHCTEHSCSFPNDKSEPSRKGTHDDKIFLECSRDNFFVAKLCPLDTSFDNRTMKCVKNYHPTTIRQHQLKILNNAQSSKLNHQHQPPKSSVEVELSKKKVIAEFRGDCANGQWCPYDGSKIQVCNVAGPKFLLCTAKGWVRKKCAPGRVFNREKGSCLMETVPPQNIQSLDKIFGQHAPDTTASSNHAEIVENSPHTIKSESVENSWFSYPWHSKSILIDPQHPLYSSRSIWPEPDIQINAHSKMSSAHSNTISNQLPTYHQTAYWNPYPNSYDQKSPHVETWRSWHNNQKPMSTNEVDLIWHFAKILARQYLQHRYANMPPRPMSQPQEPAPSYDDTAMSSTSRTFSSSGTSEYLPDYGMVSNLYGNSVPAPLPYYNQQVDWSSFLLNALHFQCLDFNLALFLIECVKDCSLCIRIIYVFDLIK
uniref:Chitin-binding type-2 domain-containing protein n=1 Tax=Romanomermis culicivorax TaxID=13658 RepID=A0A915J0R3_ROMCU